MERRRGPSGQPDHEPTGATMTKEFPEPDAFTGEVIRNGLAAAALEMNKTIKRSAYSPLIYDIQDFGVGVVSADGVLWGMATGQSLFIGLLSETVRSGLKRWDTADIVEGDVFIANDPFETGTHMSDTSIYMPAFVDGDLVAFAIATAHWADIGGKSPSGWSPDTTDVYQEGVCFGHQKLVAGHARNDALWQLIRDNVRVPRAVMGDLEAQIAACRVGVSRTQALCKRYGATTVRVSMERAVARTETAVREMIRALPDGAYQAAISLDSDGVSDKRPRVGLTITIADDQFAASFAGSSDVSAGPINMTASGSRAAIRTAMQAMLVPFERTNEGHLIPFDCELDPGLVTSAERPAPTDSYGYVATVIEELTFRALGEILPGRAPASGAMLLSVVLSRIERARAEPFVYVEPIPGGNGASDNTDGPTLPIFAIGDAPMVPIEVLEQRYPIRVERSELAWRVAGHGRQRGGMGTRREYKILEDDIYLQTSIENTRDLLAIGTAGGGTGAPGRVVVNPGRRDEEVITEKRAFRPLEAGDTVRALSGGGGGWGAPTDRDPDAVCADVRDELLDPDTACEVYKVVLVESADGLVLDGDATTRLRSGTA
jgi:N-methylhydantoinase B